MKSPSTPKSSDDVQRSPRGLLDQRDTPDLSFRRKLLISVALTLGVLLVVGTLVRQAVSGLPARFLALNSFVSLLFLVTPLLAKRGVSLPRLTIPVLLGIAVLLLHAGVSAGGVRAPLLILLPILPLIGVLFGGQRLGLAAVVICVVLDVFLLIAEQSGWTQPVLDPEHISWHLALNQMGVIFAAFAIAAIYEATRRRAEARLVEVSRLASLGTMAGGIAHEINNPLAVIAGHVERLAILAKAGAPTAAECAEIADRMTRMTARIAKVVSGLRAYARDGATDPLVPEPVVGCIQDTILLCGQSFAQDGIRLLVAPVPAGLQIKARRSEISQVILNLLSNSRDAVLGQRDPWVSIECTTRDGCVEIRVTDSGAGIDAAVRANIFVPFFTTKEVGRGAGLGLNISLGIMLQHGGALLLDEKSSNTSFVLRFPALSSESL